MAWPFSGNYEARTPNITTIKVAYADALDLALNWIYGGTKTIAKLALDATSGSAASYATGVILQVIGGSAQLDGTSGDGAGDLHPSGLSTIAPTTRRLWWQFKLVGGGTPIYGRIFYTGTSFEFTTNAQWSTVPDWVQDDNSQISLRFGIGALGGASGDISFQYKATGAGHWGNTAWSTIGTLVGSTLGFVVGGPLAATTTVTGGTGVIATTGGVTATAGGVTATAGDVVATAGNLKGRHLIGNTAPSIADGAGIGGGANHASLSSDSTDISGIITIPTDGTGSASGVICTVTLANALPTSLNVVFSMNTAPINGDATVYWASADSQHFTLNTGGTALANGTHKFSYLVSGK